MKNRPSAVTFFVVELLLEYHLYCLAVQTRRVSYIRIGLEGSVVLKEREITQRQ